MATTTSQAEVLSAIKTAQTNTVMVQCPVYIKSLSTSKAGRPYRSLKLALPNPQTASGQGRRSLYVGVTLFDEAASREGEYLFQAGKETREEDERQLYATVIFSLADLREEEYQGKTFWKLWSATILAPVACFITASPEKQEQPGEETYSQFSPDDDYVDDLS